MEFFRWLIKKEGLKIKRIGTYKYLVVDGDIKKIPTKYKKLCKNKKVKEMFIVRKKVSHSPSNILDDILFDFDNFRKKKGI